MLPHADLVVTGAPVFTVDAARSWSDAVAVRDGRIIALGSSAVEELTGPRTEVIDATGGLVLPGFQDAHVHPPFAGRNRIRVDLSGLEGKQAYLERIAAYAAANAGDGWIVGGGWAMEYFPGGVPHRDDLDAIVPDRPVFLFNRDVHGAWVNSAALRIAGVTRDTPDPADGRYERDEVTGEPTGALHEGAAYSMHDDLVPPLDLDGWQRAILDAQAHLHRLGITGWQDAWVTSGTQAAYQALADAGTLTARVVGALWWDRHRGLEQIARLVERRATGTDGNFLPTTVKIMVDGVLENQTGAMLEPYCSHGPNTEHSNAEHSNAEHLNVGLSYVERELLAAAVTELDSLGFQVHMHAIGDRAVRDALDAVEAARLANGANDLRHHIAHVQVVQPADLPRFRSLGVVANCQTYWAQSEPQMDELTLPILGPERSLMQYPFGDLHRSGAVLAMGSDWPVTTPNPLEQIEVAVRRIDPENRGKEPFLPSQVLTLPTAVAAFTAGSAYVNHDADGGSLRVGARADLAVLDRNIFAAAAGLPADASVTHTIASGAVVHRPS